MTISNTAVKAVYTGTVGQTTFAITFQYSDASQVKAYVDDVEVAKTIAGGNVVLTTPLDGTHTVTVIRVSTITQPDVFTAGAFPYTAVQTRFDKITEMMQEAFEKINRCAQAGLSSIVSLVFPAPVANNFIGWNSLGTALENKDSSSLTTMASSIQTLQNAQAVDEANIAEMEIDIVALESTTGTLGTRMTNAEGTISGHTGTLSTHGTRITDLESLAGSLTTINTTLGNLHTADLVQQGRLDAVESTESSHTSTLSSYGTRIGNLETTVSGLSNQASNIATIQGQISTINSQINAIQAKDLSQDTTLGDLVSRVSALETQAYQLARRKIGSMTIANNISSPVNVIGETNGSILNLNKAGALSAEVFIELERKTDSKHIFTTGKFVIQYITNTWYILRNTTTSINGVMADDSTADGMTLTITTDGFGVGQVQYTTDNMAGTNYYGKIRWIVQEMSNTF